VYEGSESINMESITSSKRSLHPAYSDQMMIHEKPWPGQNEN
jgi:hypothetical protein